MKGLKFRVWDIERECYLDEVELAGITPDGKYILYIEEEEISKLEIEGNYIIEQYTSLKDKNGKEIFEGDLVAYEKDNIASVRFEYGGFYPFVEPYNDFDCPSGKEVEVIGNIHESNMEEE